MALTTNDAPTATDVSAGMTTVTVSAHAMSEVLFDDVQAVTSRKLTVAMRLVQFMIARLGQSLARIELRDSLRLLSNNAARPERHRWIFRMEIVNCFGIGPRTRTGPAPMRRRVIDI